MGKYSTNQAMRTKYAAPGNVVSDVIENPKRGASAKRFALYATLGKTFTVAKYVEAVEKRKLGNKTLAECDICWDVQHGFIKITMAARAARQNAQVGKGGVTVAALPAPKAEEKQPEEAPKTE